MNTIGAVSLFDDKSLSPLEIGVAAKDVLSSSAKLAVSYLAAFRQPPGFARDELGRDAEWSVQDVFQAIQIPFFDRAHIFLTMQGVNCI